MNKLVLARMRSEPAQAAGELLAVSFEVALVGIRHGIMAHRLDDVESGQFPKCKERSSEVNAGSENTSYRPPSIYGFLNQEACQEQLAYGRKHHAK